MRHINVKVGCNRGRGRSGGRGRPEGTDGGGGGVPANRWRVDVEQRTLQRSPNLSASKHPTHSYAPLLMSHSLLCKLFPDRKRGLVEMGPKGPRCAAVPAFCIEIPAFRTHQADCGAGVNGRPAELQRGRLARTPSPWALCGGGGKELGSEAVQPSGRAIGKHRGVASGPKQQRQGQLQGGAVAGRGGWTLRAYGRAWAGGWATLVLGKGRLRQFSGTGL